MAKRFGRNQRRKMREEIAWKERRISGLEFELRGSRKSENETNAKYIEIARRLKSWADDVVQLMGRDSAFNEQVRRMEVDEKWAAAGQFSFPVVDVARFSPRPMSMPMASVQTVLEALIWRLHMSRSEFNGMVRIELENRYGEPVGYALSPDHVWTEKDAQYLADRIAREMVNHLNQSRAMQNNPALSAKSV